MKIWATGIVGTYGNFWFFILENKDVIGIGCTLEEMQTFWEYIVKHEMEPINFSIENGRLIPSSDYLVNGRSPQDLIDIYNSKIHLYEKPIKIKSSDKHEIEAACFKLGDSGSIDISIATNEVYKYSSISFVNKLYSIRTLKFSESAEIKVGRSVDEIGPLVFNGSVAQKVEFNDILVKIGDSAFAGCYLLKSLDFPKSLRIIDRSAFFFCKSIKTVNFNEGLLEICNGAFELCIALESVETPKSLKYICDGAFKSCVRLSRVILNEGLRKIGREAFNNCAITEIEVPRSIMICDPAFASGCTGLREVRIPRGFNQSEMFKRQMRDSNITVVVY